MNWTREIESEIIANYGLPGEHQVCLDLPYKMKLSWDESIWIDRFLCHEKVKKSLNKILVDVNKAYTVNEINTYGFNIWGGCLKVRYKSSLKELSLHSWGIAIDINPNKNKFLWDSEKALFAKDCCLKWWEIWEAYNWYSLGRNNNYDWMHIQATK